MLHKLVLDSIIINIKEAKLNPILYSSFQKLRIWIIAEKEVR